MSITNILEQVIATLIASVIFSLCGVIAVRVMKNRKSLPKIDTILSGMAIVGAFCFGGAMPIGTLVFIFADNDELAFKLGLTLVMIGILIIIAYIIMQEELAIIQKERERKLIINMVKDKIESAAPDARVAADPDEES